MHVEPLDDWFEIGAGQSDRDGFLEREVEQIVFVSCEPVEQGDIAIRQGDPERVAQISGRESKRA